MNKEIEKSTASISFQFDNEEEIEQIKILFLMIFYGQNPKFKNHGMNLRDLDFRMELDTWRILRALQSLHKKGILRRINCGNPKFAKDKYKISEECKISLLVENVTPDIKEDLMIS